MRTILFKAKRLDTKEWVEGLYFKTPLTDENTGVDMESGWFFLSDGVERHCIVKDTVAYEIDPETVCQWTGATDNNGKKIFEGDVFRVEEDTDDGTDRDYCVCVWIKEECFFGWLSIGEYLTYSDNGINSLDDFGVPYNVTEKNGNEKVITNIYDTPISKLFQMCDAAYEDEND